ncbi:HdeD family acid-resistance protein [Leadbetterella sp. DM7]|uniref:HdeD family acid-resistance protein n=1 Tax=Leadbetterella sp. DM7 TaxID=3235085 RepID=UPI00349F0155
MATFLKTIRNTVKHWYAPAIIGVLFIVLGVYIFTVPEMTYLSLVVLFSYSFLFSGVLEIWFSIENRRELEGWGWYLASGIFSLLIGILLVIHPVMAAATLPLFVGFSLLFRSFQGLGFAFELRNYGVLKWGNLALVSVLGIIFSFLLIANPIVTGVSLVVLTALSFIFVGVNAIVLAFQLRKLKTLPGRVQKDLKDKIESLKEEYYKNLNNGN